MEGGGYLSYCRNYVKKNCFPRKISLKSDNRLLSHGQKLLSIWRLYAILSFKNVHIWSRVCHRVTKMLLCSEVHHNRMIFLLRYGDLTIFKMAAVRHLEFSKLVVCVT